MKQSRYAIERFQPSRNAIHIIGATLGAFARDAGGGAVGVGHGDDVG